MQFEVTEPVQFARPLMKPQAVSPSGACRVHFLKRTVLRRSLLLRALRSLSEAKGPCCAPGPGWADAHASRAQQGSLGLLLSSEVTLQGAQGAKACRRAMAQVLCKSLPRHAEACLPVCLSACQAGGIWDERPAAKQILAWVVPDPRDVSRDLTTVSKHRRRVRGIPPFVRHSLLRHAKRALSSVFVSARASAPTCCQRARDWTASLRFR